MAIHTDDGKPADAAAQALRVLVVEDSGLIAAKIAQTLRSGGCQVVGPAATLAAALDLVAPQGAALDAALLDIDLRGEAAYPLAEALRACGVPFLFLTGYERPAIPEAWRQAPRVEKPFEAAVLLKALDCLVAAAPMRPDAQADPAAPFSELDRRMFATMRASRNLVMESRILREEVAGQR